MCPGLGAYVNAGALMEEQPIDWRRDRAGDRITTYDTVMSAGPHGDTSAPTPAVLEIIRQPRPPAHAALVRRESRVRSGKGHLPFLQPEKFHAGGENIRCEQGHILERPGQKRRNHRLRH